MSGSATVPVQPLQNMCRGGWGSEWEVFGKCLGKCVGSALECVGRSREVLVEVGLAGVGTAELSTNVGRPPYKDV